MASNKSDSFETYTQFVDSGCVGLNTPGITFNPPPKALYVIQAGSGSRAVSFQYRNLDGEIVFWKAIDGAGTNCTILEIGDCEQILSINDRAAVDRAASADDKVIGLY